MQEFGNTKAGSKNAEFQQQVSDGYVSLTQLFAEIENFQKRMQDVNEAVTQLQRSRVWTETMQEHFERTIEPLQDHLTMLTDLVGDTPANSKAEVVMKSKLLAHLIEGENDMNARMTHSLIQDLSRLLRADEEGPTVRR